MNRYMIARLFLALALVVIGLSYPTQSSQAAVQAQENQIFTLTLLTAEPLIVNTPFQVEMKFVSPFGAGYYQGEWMLNWPYQLNLQSWPCSADPCSKSSVFSGNTTQITQNFTFNTGTPGTYTIHLEWFVQDGSHYYSDTADLVVVVTKPQAVPFITGIDRNPIAGRRVCFTGENFFPVLPPGTLMSDLQVWFILDGGGVNWQDLPTIVNNGGSWTNEQICLTIPANLKYRSADVVVKVDTKHSGATPFGVNILGQTFLPVVSSDN